MYEYQVIKFLKGILAVAGIEDEPTFTRSKLINVSESITSVLSAGEYLGPEYVTQKILTILGDGEKAEEILKKMDADELEMGGVTTPPEEVNKANV